MDTLGSFVPEMVDHLWAPHPPVLPTLLCQHDFPPWDKGLKPQVLHSFWNNTRAHLPPLHGHGHLQIVHEAQNLRNVAPDLVHLSYKLLPWGLPYLQTAAVLFGIFRISMTHAGLWLVQAIATTAVRLPRSMVGDHSRNAMPELELMTWPVLPTLASNLAENSEIACRPCFENYHTKYSTSIIRLLFVQSSFRTSVQVRMYRSHYHVLSIFPSWSLAVRPKRGKEWRGEALRVYLH